jgi:heme-degrading monooxygenase HmoA
MFGSIRCYFVHKLPADELVRRVDEDFAARIEAQPGFVSYEFLDAGGGEVASISVFREATQAEASRDLARRWTDENLKDLELTVTETLHGAILVSRTETEGRMRGRPATDRLYARLRRYRLKRGDVAELSHAIADFADRLAEIDGFVSYRVFDCGAAELLSVSVLRDESAAAASEELALTFVREQLDDFELERADIVGGGEIAVSRKTGEALESLPG